jgi:hypothetical protein
MPLVPLTCLYCHAPFTVKPYRATKALFCCMRHAFEYRTEPVEERFWRYVEKRGLDECWPWQGEIAENGYGRLFIGGKKRRIQAHVYSYQLHGGILKDQLLALHTCNNKSCVNPKHLYAGTTLQNAQDAVRNGRYRNGEANGNSKLTIDKVRFIRANGDLYTHAQLARIVGVSSTQVHNILHRITWRSVD